MKCPNCGHEIRIVLYDTSHLNTLEVDVKIGDPLTYCPLCHLSEESKHYEDESFLVVDTKNMKGHKARMMVVYKKHKRKISKELQAEGISILVDCMQAKARWFCVMAPKFASYPEHWHLVASDYDGNDTEQMAATPKILEITKNG